MVAQKDDGTFYTQEEIAGTGAQEIIESLPLEEQTFIGVVQHRGESSGIIAERQADQGGQIFQFNIDLPIPPTLVTGTPDDDVFEALFSDDREFVGDGQTLLAGSGDDYVDVTGAMGDNTIRLASGKDMVLAGKNDRLEGGADDDIFFLGLGEGNNRITGGTGMDQFWLSEDDDHLFTEGRNIIADFNTDEGDVIGLAATSLSFDSDDFNLIQEGANTVIETFGQEIAVLNGINSTELTAANFVFA